MHSGFSGTSRLRTEFLSRLGTVPFLESTRALKTHDGVIPGIRRFLSNFGVEDGALRFRDGKTPINSLLDIRAVGHTVNINVIEGNMENLELEARLSGPKQGISRLLYVEKRDKLEGENAVVVYDAVVNGQYGQVYGNIEVKIPPRYCGLRISTHGNIFVQGVKEANEVSVKTTGGELNWGSLSAERISLESWGSIRGKTLLGNVCTVFASNHPIHLGKAAGIHIALDAGTSDVKASSIISSDLVVTASEVMIKSLNTRANGEDGNSKFLMRRKSPDHDGSTPLGGSTTLVRIDSFDGSADIRAPGCESSMGDVQWKGGGELPTNSETCPGLNVEVQLGREAKILDIYGDQKTYLKVRTPPGREVIVNNVPGFQEANVVWLEGAHPIDYQQHHGKDPTRTGGECPPDSDTFPSMPATGIGQKDTPPPCIINSKGISRIEISHCSWIASFLRKM